jgi:hypothetical protein
VPAHFINPSAASSMLALKLSHVVVGVVASLARYEPVVVAAMIQFNFQRLLMKINHSHSRRAAKVAGMARGRRQLCPLLKNSSRRDN